MRTIGRLLGTAAAGAAIVLLSPVGFTAHADAYKCDDFTYQEDAQAIYDQYPGDPYDLDRNKDGVACENRPHRPVSQQTSSSKPAPATGTTSKPTTAPKSTTTHSKTTTAPQVQVKPRGGVDTGDGSTLDVASDPLAVTAGGAAVAGIAAGTGVLLIRRRANR